MVGWRKAKIFMVPMLHADPDIYTKRTVEVSFGTLVHVFRPWIFVCGSWPAPVPVMMMMLRFVVHMEEEEGRTFP